MCHQTVFCGIEAGEYLQTVLIKHFTFTGELERAGGALKQFYLQTSFQTGNGFANRRAG